MAKRKYPTLTSLVRAFNDRKLDDYQLMVDKDSSWLRYIGEGTLEYQEAKNDECYDWYRGYGRQDVIELYEELGINADWC